MTREQLEQYVNQRVATGEQYLFLRMNGDPNGRRQKLLGHKWGPYGWCVGHESPDNIVRFNAEYVQEYLDELPVEKLGGSDEVYCEIAYGWQ
jgi:hypothetical protein